MTRRTLSPVLLVGAGHGEATCGILYLAAFLRRNGIEAFVRLFDADESDEEVAASMQALLGHVKPKAVGISLKWFNHVSRALLLAKTVRALDPEVRVVVGGNTASYWWEELAGYDVIDDLILGDGEVPLLALARGDAHVPNLVTRGPNGEPRRKAQLEYVQSEATKDAHYSNFDELFLSQQDQHQFSGWVAPGKGCSENCVYCGGGRGMQQGSFGRAESFLRPIESVRQDHEVIAGHTWQLRYDFSGGTAEFLSGVWKGLDLSKHSTTYFLWGLPPRSLIDTLARTFGSVYMVLDIGCFSQLQRLELISRGLLKPCPTNTQLIETVHACAQHQNLKLEVCGIGGLPFTSDKARAQEAALVEQLLSLGCDVGSQRLESQPGALVTQHADRFGMVSEARTFREFVDFFAARGHVTDGVFPMVRYEDAHVEAEVQRAADRLQEAMQRNQNHLLPAVDGRTRLVSAIASRKEISLGEWLGTFKVPRAVAKEKVTLVRAPNGAGLACAPGLSPRRFEDPSLQQGKDAGVLLKGLDAFARPITVDAAVQRLAKEAKLDARSARELVEHLAEGRFLQRV